MGIFEISLPLFTVMIPHYKKRQHQLSPQSQGTWHTLRYKMCHYYQLHKIFYSVSGDNIKCLQLSTILVFFICKTSQKSKVTSSSLPPPPPKIPLLCLKEWILKPTSWVQYSRKHSKIIIKKYIYILVLKELYVSKVLWINVWMNLDASYHWLYSAFGFFCNYK